MKVLLYGGRGWIGQQFRKWMPSSWRVDYGDARVDDVKLLKLELDEYAPTHVVCMVGRTRGQGHTTIDYLQLPEALEENVRDNLFGPIVLARECQRRGIHLTYVGTGCIFKYDRVKHPQPYTEEDEPNFFGSNYSIVKGFTDRLMHLFEETVLNLRIRMPISGEPHEKNFITKIVSYEKVIDIPNSMTVLPSVFPYWIRLMERRYTGTLNMCNPGVMSHHEILYLYKQIVDPSFTYRGFSEEEMLKITLAGRSNNALDTSKVEYLFPNIPHIRDAVIKSLENYKTQL